MLKMFLKLIWDTIRSLVQSIGQVTRGVWSSVCLLLTGIFKLQPGEMKSPLLILVSLLVIGGSLISIIRTECRPRPKANLAPVLGAGAVGAEQVAKLLNQRGRIVLWVPKAGGAGASFVETTIESFQDGLKNFSELLIVATEEQEWYSTTQQPVAKFADAFVRALERHATADAIVSFVGIPPLRPEDYARLRAPRPKMVSIDVAGMVTKEMFEKGVVQLAILPRHTPPPDTGTRSPTPREWFDAYFMVVTPENTADLLY